jgi:hypothetical protein
MYKKLSFFLLNLLVLYCFSETNTSIDFFSNLYLGADLKFFKFQKNEEFQQKYLTENNFYIDVSLISFKNLSLNFLSEQKAGMGKSSSGLIFHPSDISFSLDPYFKYFFNTFELSEGLDHRCFHEIDKKEEETVFWNKIFTKVNSKNNRLLDFAAARSDTERLFIPYRWSWSITWGYYMRDFFGLVASNKIMSDQPGYVMDLTFDSRFGLFSFKNSIINLTGSTLIGTTRSHATYFCQETGIEANFISSQLGGSIFVNYIIDNNRNWFDSKDRLLELGARLFK